RTTAAAIAASDEETTPIRPMNIPATPTSTTATGATSASSQIVASVVPDGSPSLATIFPCLRTWVTVGFSTASDTAINAVKKSGMARIAATAKGALGAV